MRRFWKKKPPKEGHRKLFGEADIDLPNEVFDLLGEYQAFAEEATRRGFQYDDLTKEYDDLGIERKLSDPFDIWMKIKRAEWEREGVPYVMSKAQAQKLSHPDIVRVMTDKTGLWDVDDD